MTPRRRDDAGNPPDPPPPCGEGGGAGAAMLRTPNGDAYALQATGPHARRDPSSAPSRRRAGRARTKPRRTGAPPRAPHRDQGRLDQVARATCGSVFERRRRGDLLNVRRPRGPPRAIQVRLALIQRQIHTHPSSPTCSSLRRRRRIAHRQSLRNVRDQSAGDRRRPSTRASHSTSCRSHRSRCGAGPERSADASARGRAMVRARRGRRGASQARTCRGARGRLEGTHLSTHAWSPHCDA